MRKLIEHIDSKTHIEFYIDINIQPSIIADMILNKNMIKIENGTAYIYSEEERAIYIEIMNIENIIRCAYSEILKDEKKIRTLIYSKLGENKIKEVFGMNINIDGMIDSITKILAYDSNPIPCYSGIGKMCLVVTESEIILFSYGKLEPFIFDAININQIIRIENLKELVN